MINRKNIIIIVSLLTILNAEKMPIDARPGQCFTKSFYPPQYTKVTKIKSKKRVLINDASIKYEVIPAKYSVYEKRVKVSDGTEKIVTTPAVYKTVTERVLIEPSSKVWRRALNRNSKKAFGSCVQAVSNMGFDIDNAPVGSCFYEHYQPEKYITTTSKILSKEASSKIIVTPAKYETVTKKIMVDSTDVKLIPSKAVYKKVADKVVIAPARTEWRKTICDGRGCNQSEIICLTEVPTTYKKVTKKVMLQPAVKKTQSVKPLYKTFKVKKIVQPATIRSVEIPAQYKILTKREKVENARYFWTDESGKNDKTRVRSECDKICLVSTPAKYKTISKQLLVKPAQSRKVKTPPKYKIVKIKKMIEKARFKKVVIPAEYVTVRTERERTKGYAKWMPVVCESQLTSKTIKKVQEALKLQGFYQGEINGIWDIPSKSAVRAYQRDNGLSITNKLSIETMLSLNIY